MTMISDQVMDAIPADKRQQAMDRYMTEYQRLNPNCDKAAYAGTRDNMEKLIEAKLTLFPTDMRQIVNARLVSMGEKDRIEAVSARIG